MTPLSVVVKAVAHAAGQHYHSRERTEDGGWRPRSPPGRHRRDLGVGLRAFFRGTDEQLPTPAEVEVLEPTLLNMPFQKVLAKVGRNK